MRDQRIQVMPNPVRFKRGKWFHAVTAELEAQGFSHGGRAIPHLVMGFFRKGVHVEIHGGQTLRVVHQNGRAYTHPGLSIEKAIQIIGAAQISADFPD